MKISLGLLHLTTGILEANQRHEWSVWFRSTTMPLCEALRPLAERIAIRQIDRRAPGASRTPGFVEPFAAGAKSSSRRHYGNQCMQQRPSRTADVEMTGESLITFRLLIQFAL